MTIEQLHEELTRILENNICDPDASILVNASSKSLRELDEVNFTSGNKVIILKTKKYSKAIFGN